MNSLYRGDRPLSCCARTLLPKATRLDIVFSDDNEGGENDAPSFSCIYIQFVSSSCKNVTHIPEGANKANDERHSGLQRPWFGAFSHFYQVGVSDRFPSEVM